MSSRDLAPGVVLASPGALGLGLLIIWGLFRLYRRDDAELTWQWQPTAVGGSVALLFAVITAVNNPRFFELKKILVALYFFGASYLTLLLVTWRVLMVKNRDIAFTWAWLPPTLLQLIPAILCVMGLSLSSMVDLWLLPGYGGLTTLVALIYVFCEPYFRKLGRRS